MFTDVQSYKHTNNSSRLISVIFACLHLSIILRSTDVTLNFFKNRCLNTKSNVDLKIALKT